MAEVLSLISTISFIAAAVFLVITIILWFTFKVPKLAGDLSGRNARKSIDLMRSHAALQNKATVNRNVQTDKVFEKKVVVGEDEERETETLELESKTGKNVTVEQETGLLSEDLIEDEYATALLDTTDFVVPGRKGGMQLRMIKSVVCVNTDEVIDI